MDWAAQSQSLDGTARLCQLVWQVRVEQPSTSHHNSVVRGRNCADKHVEVWLLQNARISCNLDVGHGNLGGGRRLRHARVGGGIAAAVGNNFAATECVSAPWKHRVVQHLRRWKFGSRLPMAGWRRGPAGANVLKAVADQYRVLPRGHLFSAGSQPKWDTDQRTGAAAGDQFDRLGSQLRWRAQDPRRSGQR